LDRIKRLLRLHTNETSELIHQFYKFRLAEQNTMVDKPYGQLTVRGYFRNKTVLEIEILSARNLPPMNNDGTSDAFVKVHFSPEEQFKNVKTPQTNVQNKTLFPMFDERFEM
jgi:BAI1-associated protein 3